MKPIDIYRKKQIVKWISSLLFALLMLPGILNATHIIGGEINYSCLGNEQFEVELTVFRDCFFGADDALFDDPASIGIFDSNGVLLDELKLPYLNNDTLTPILSDSCLFVPPTVCVHTASYRGEVNLPFSAGGYTLVYQRCCRNETITNIVDPLNTGATFTATVSGASILECNSGPKFKEFPPLFICVNEPINWDHSAEDVEGDSLVYSLCTPYTGGDIINNQPQPPNPPPYNTISWLGSFGLNNVLGGTEVLAIDAQTGLLTGTPVIQGQFVVGICIEEYRDGQLISTSRRDFQYNVGECGIVAASIGNDTIQCENQELTFINTSSNANDFEWYFGNPANPGLNSILEDPIFVFPDTGVFTVTLIAEPNGECADTLVQDILFKNSTLEVDFDLLILECVDSVLLTTNNMSIDTFLGIESILWELSDGQTSNEFDPTFVLAQSQEYTLTLTATAFDGCSETQEFDFFGNVINSGVVDTFAICPGESVQLNENPFLGPNVTYIWSPEDGLDDINSVNPTANPSVSTLYTVSIDDPDLDCAGSFSILVEVQENNAIISFNDNELICTEEYTVAAQTQEIISYEWSQDANFTNVISTESSFTYTESGQQNFYLRTIDEGGCTFTDQVSINAGALNVEVIVDDQACLNQGIATTANNFDSVDDVSITWEPASAVLSGQGTLNAVLNPMNIGENIYYANITNQFGCERMDTFMVNVISDLALTNLDIEVGRENCDASIVMFTTDHINIGNYLYEFPDGTSVVGENEVTFTFSGQGTFEVILVPQNFVTCEGLEPVVLDIEVPTDFYDTGFENELTSCGDIIEVSLTDVSIPFVGSTTTVDWVFDNGLVASGQTVALTFDQGGVYPFEVTLVSDLDCSTTYQGTLDLTNSNVLDVSFIDQNILACNGDPVGLNPNGNVLYNYLWAPAIGVDDASAVNPMTSPASTSTFTVVVTDPVTGCVVEREVTVNVPEQQLEADFSWSFQSCVGDAEIQLVDESVYSAAEIIAWEWSLSDRSEILTAQNPSITVSTIQDLIVTLTVFTEDGCEESISQSIGVDLVELNLPDNNTFICFGESIELNPNGSQAYTYEWAPADELSTALGANPIASPAATTTYSVTVTDDNTGCVVEQSFDILVATELPQAGFDYEILNCDDNDPLEVQFTSTSTYADADVIAFAWTILADGNTLTSDEENPLFTFDGATTLTATLSITTEDGCTDDFVLAEEQINVIDFIVAEDRVTICKAVPTVLNENADPDLTYSWTPALGLSNANSASPTANPAETTVYTVTISYPEKGLCEVSQEIEVFVPEFEVDVDFDANYLSCGTSAEVQFTDLSTATGTDIVAWSWDFGNGLSSDLQNPVIGFDASTMLNPTLTVTTLDGCEIELLNAQSLPVEVIVIDEQSFQETLNVCMGESVFLNDEADAQYDYLWSPAENLDDPTSPNPEFINADQSTEFTVTITNVSIDTCMVVRTISVNVFDSPAPVINADGQENICTETGELSIDLAPGESVIWYDDIDLQNQISTEATIITNPGTGTTYFAMVTNQFGCGSELVSFMSTSRELTLESDISTQSLCLDNETELNGIVTSTEIPTTYTWTPEGQIDEFLTESSILISPESNTTYTLTGTNIYGCEAQTTFNVDVVDLLSTIDTEIQTTDLITGEPVTLSVEDNSTYAYIWSPANLLDDATIFNPTFTLIDEVNFEVEITDQNGCTAVLSLVVIPPTPVSTPCEEPYVFVPNAFSPNGDGLNERLRVDGNQITEMYLAIYNRWGELVFETDDQAVTWDGTYKGRALDPDVFGYIFTATCTNGDNFSSQGNISLLK